MSGAHEPREAFVEELEHRLRADFRRRVLAPAPSFWMLKSRLAFAASLAVVVLASMAAGGGVVAASYHARQSEQRDLLIKTLEQRAVIAQQRLELATMQLKDVQQRMSVGVASQDAVTDAQFRVREADAEVKLTALDIDEVRASGREPSSKVSAPLVGNRDFVTERWKIERSIPQAALVAEQARLQAARTRVEVGVGSPLDVAALEARLIELQAATEVIDRKLTVRQTFLMGGLHAAGADLRALEAEVEPRRTALQRRIEYSRREVGEIRKRVEIGTANPLDVAGAELRLQELQLEASKLDYDLLLIRKQLAAK